MEKTDKIGSAPFSYLELLRYCIRQFTKADFQTCIEKWHPKIKKSELRKMRRKETEALLLSIATETRARSLYKKQPEKFGLFAEEIQDFFHINLTGATGISGTAGKNPTGKTIDRRRIARRTDCSTGVSS